MRFGGTSWRPFLGKLLYTYDDPPSEKHLKQACNLLENDGVLCYPMGSNWAFGCDASKPKALDRIRLLKPEHPKAKSFSLICSSIKMASSFGHIDHQLYRILKKVWPGPYTILVKSTLSLPRQIKDKRQIVGLKIPDCQLMRALVEAYGKPMATTSVPKREDGFDFKMGYEIEEVYGHALDLILDLGEELSGEESTIVDFSEGYPEIIREGLGDISIFSV